jgi:hypothetical protein
LVALRCTQRLLRRLHVSVAAASPGEAGNALGHWYANVVTLNRIPFVLAVSERSLLSVVLPGAPFTSLVARFPQALAQLLRALAIPESQVKAEVASMSPLVTAATANRQILGCLNQFAFELSAHFSDEPHKTLLERELWLSDSISSAIRYSVPRDLTIELLATRNKQ